MDSGALHFAATPATSSRMLTIDYGFDPVADISVRMDGSYQCIERKNIDRSGIAISLKYPALPLIPPNVDPLIAGLFSERDLCRHESGRVAGSEYIRTHVFEHLEDFYLRHAKLRHEGLLASLDDDEQLLSDVQQMVLQKDQLSAMATDFQTRFINKGRSNWSMTCREYCGLAAEFDFSDIPHDLLVQLTDESLFMDYEDFAMNHNLRNCIVEWTNSERNTAHLVYPCCATLDKLQLSTLLMEHVDNGNLLSALPVELYPLPGMLKELFRDGHLMLARGNYYIDVYELVESEDKLKKLYDFRMDQLIKACTFSCTLPHEVIAVLNHGQVLCITGSGNPVEVRAADKSYKPTWQSCLYGSCPRTCLVGDENEVLLLDFRLPSTKSSVYFELPSEYMNKLEKLAPALIRHPDQPHQCWLTTDQTLMLTDERYLKTPLLRCNHYMKSMPRFAQCIPDVCTSTNDEVLVTLGNYLDRESICFRFKSNGSQVISTSELDPTNTAMEYPWTMSARPFKFAAYDDWQRFSRPSWQFSNMAFMQRLQQPLIGMRVVKLPTSASRGHDFAFVQQTLCGDVFYQKFTWKPRNQEEDDASLQKEPSFSKSFLGTCSNSDFKLSQQARERIGSWIREAYDDYENGKSIVQTLFEIPVDSDLISTLSLRNSRMTEKPCEAPIDMERKIFSDISRLCKDNILLTNKSLGLEPVTRDLPPLPDVDIFENPISKVLAGNWDSSEYVPLEAFAPHCKYKPSYRK